jgi:pre-mRNA-splicing factor SPF27
MAKVLAIETAAYGQSSGWRKGEDLIDALPYIDTLPPELKQQVDALIEEELKKSTKKPADYLREMPPMPTTAFEGHPMLANEFERVKSKAPMAPLDMTRYRLEAPVASKRHDFGAWKASVDNAHSQLEHQYLRITNLELMLKYGDKNWRAQGQLVDSLVKQYETELAETKKQITAVNLERKLQQTAAGNELRKAETEYQELVLKNIEIEMACDRLEKEISEKVALHQQHQE